MTKQADEQGAAADELIKKQQDDDGTDDGDDGAGSDDGQNSDAIPREEYDKLKHSYDVLQGKYNAEVPRLHDEVADLRVMISDVNKTAKSKQEDTQVPEGVSQLREEFPAVDEALDWKIKKHVSEAMTGIEDRFKTVEATATKTTTNSIKSDLSRLAPGWDSVDNDPKFHAWLREPDRYTGKPKQELLNESYYGGNSQNVANFFLDYMEESGYKPPAENKDLGKYESPPPGSTRTPVKRDDTEEVSREQVAQYYRDVTAGKYRGREKESASMEAKIERAMLKGKIT
jgi:hypothetical protein